MQLKRRNKRSSILYDAEQKHSVARPAKRKRTRQQTFTKSMDDLPDELMLVILESIVNDMDVNRPDACYKALHSLSRTSHRYHRLATPYLYSCVDNRCFDPARILYAYCNQSDLQGAAKHIMWVDDANFHQFLAKAKLSYNLRHPERRELCKAVHTMGLPQHQERHVRQAIKEQSSDDLLALFLILSPNVETLEVADSNICIRPRGYWRGPLWTRVVRFATVDNLDSLQLFRHLRRIVIRMGPICLSSVFPFLKLPALHEFVLANAFRSEGLWAAVGAQTKSSTVQRLSFEGSLIETDAIVDFVNAIKCLTEFRYEFGDAIGFEEQIRDNGYPGFSYEALRTALAPHNDTLKTLRIVNLEYYGYSSLADGDTLGSLREMTSVREIEVSLDGFHVDSEEYVQDHANLRDNLPPNINFLRVYVENCDVGDDPYESQWWKDSLRDLAQDCKVNYPHLRTIVVSDKPIGVLPIDEDVRKLKVQFKEQGVSLFIKGEHLAMPIPAVQEWKKLTADRDIVLNGMDWKSKMHAINICKSHENECLLRNWRGPFPRVWLD